MAAILSTICPRAVSERNDWVGRRVVRCDAPPRHRGKTGRHECLCSRGGGSVARVGRYRTYRFHTVVDIGLEICTVLPNFGVEEEATGSSRYTLVSEEVTNEFGCGFSTYKSANEILNANSIVPQSCPDATWYHSPQLVLEPDRMGLGMGLTRIINKRQSRVVNRNGEYCTYAAVVAPVKTVVVESAVSA